MKTISVEELLNKKEQSMTLVDLRKKEDYQKATIKNAVSLPSKELNVRFEEIPTDKAVYAFCYTGYTSREAAEFLEEKGYEVYSVEGGYRSYLRIHLAELVKQEDTLAERTREIEKSIIKNKRFHREIWSKFVKAIQFYELIQEGDKIAVCISGGKDSMLLAKLFQELKRHRKMHFELAFIVMDPGYNPENRQIIEDNAKLLGIPIEIFHSEIFDTVAEITDSPCYLCARMRRGNLYSHAKEIGCNKIALGHHFDDVIETVLMGMFYAGKIETMMPKLHSKNFEGMELIRPMYMIKEEEILAWRDVNSLGFIQCACRFTEACTSCSSETSSKREEMKQLIKKMRRGSSVIDKNIFRSIHDINLSTVIGYHKGDEHYSFTDDYNKIKK